MTAKPKLSLVAGEPADRETRIRALLAELDQAEATAANVRAELAEQGTAYARERGEFMRASIDRLRRDLGAA